MALMTRTEVKAALGITSTGQDAQIDALLEPVSNALQALTGRQIEDRTVTEYHDGAGQTCVVLNHRPITAVTSVHDDLTGSYGSGTEVDSDNYRIDYDRGMIRLTGAVPNDYFITGRDIDAYTFQDGSLNVKVVYSAGYPSGHPMLDAAELVFAELMAQALNRAANAGLESERLGDYSYKVSASDEAALSMAARGALKSLRSGGAIA